VSAEATAAVHEAIGGLLGEGEIADRLVPGRRRCRTRRRSATWRTAQGAGSTAAEGPVAWAALGMLRASVGCAEVQLAEMTADVDEDGEDEGEE
jgi:hypothetical protein